MPTYREVLTAVQAALDTASVWCGHGYLDTHDEAVALVLAAVGLPVDTPPNILDEVFPQSASQTLSEYVEQRTVARLPVAYITGEAWLGPCLFASDSRALVPRSPIAELVQQGFLPWWRGEVAPGHIVDVCCGGGSLGLLAAWVFPDAKLTLMDLDSDALSLARENIERHEAQSRASVLQADLLTPLAPDSVDIILANPPYVDAPEMASLAPEYRHEPRLALAAGEDGLDLIPSLLAQASVALTQDGLLFLEVGNSWHAMEARYPRFPFVWLELENGGEGVTVLTREELRQLAS